MSRCFDSVCLPSFYLIDLIDLIDLILGLLEDLALDPVTVKKETKSLKGESKKMQTERDVKREKEKRKKWKTQKEMISK